MKIHLYTSFTLSAGYQYASLTEQGLKSPTIPSAIKADFVNGSSKIVLRGVPSEDLAYLVVKDIDYLNTEKQIDEQGRKVFINFALETEMAHFSDLAHVFMGLICNWNNAIKYLGQLYTIPYSSNEFNYSVDLQRFMGLINNLKSSTNSCAANIRDVINRFSDRDGLIVIKGNDKEYFRKMTDDITPRNRVRFTNEKRYLITENEFEKAIKSSEMLKDYSAFCKNINDNLNQTECITENIQEGEANVDDPALSDRANTEQQCGDANSDALFDKRKEPESIKSTTENLKSFTPIMKNMNKKYVLYLIGSFVLGMAIGYTLQRLLSSN